MPRLEVAIIGRDGTAEIVNAARPATLVAFSDAHDGKLMPETIREIAWVVHHALAVDEPIDDWLATLEDISAAPEDVELAKRIVAGDDDARKIALGELPRPPEEEPDNGPPPDPALEQLGDVMVGGRPSPE